MRVSETSPNVGRGVISGNSDFLFSDPRGTLRISWGARGCAICFRQVGFIVGIIRF
jgi:hypothetical protein